MPNGSIINKNTQLLSEQNYNVMIQLINFNQKQNIHGNQ